MVFINNMIVQQVHHRNVVEQLIAADVAEVTNTTWTNHIRHKLVNGEVKINIGQMEPDYGYEYIGTPLMLVVTPLTCEAYLTHCTSLTQGKMGSAFGPAGTGKTETVKDLARHHLGQLCIVFNTSN